MGKPVSFKTLHDKRLSTDVAGVAEGFYFREQIQTVIKPRFYPRLCQFLMKIIPIIELSVRMRQDVC